MVNTVIRKNIPQHFFEKFLKHLIHDNNEYILTYDCFKSLEVYDIPQKFINELREYYYPHKHYYLNRTSYKSFGTILRQISRHLNLGFRSKVKYYQNKYSIIYVISLNDTHKGHNLK